MNSELELVLARAARTCGRRRRRSTGGFPSQALSRAYHAAFHAASAALMSIGEAPHTRTGVISAFGRRIVSEGGLDHEVGRKLRRLFDDADYVDYALGEAPPERASSAITDAALLLDATVRWIERQSAAA